MHHTQELKKSINAIRRLKKVAAGVEQKNRRAKWKIVGEEKKWKLPLKRNFPVHISMIDDGGDGGDVSETLLWRNSISAQFAFKRKISSLNKLVFKNWAAHVRTR